MIRPLVLCAITLLLPLAGCGTASLTPDMAERRGEAIPRPPLPDSPADDGTLATLAKQATLEEALDNETRGWRNPRTGAFGTVTPLRTAGGCRDFRETLLRDGREVNSTGTACKNREGVWVVTKD